MSQPGSTHPGLPHQSKIQDFLNGRLKLGHLREICSVTINHLERPLRQPKPPTMRIFFVDGAPQFTIFCDGSSENTRFAQFRGDKGGYGVVFRDPYETVSHNDVDLAPNRLKPEFFGKEKEDDRGVDDFVILNWLSRKVYSADHAEISALSQGLDEVTKRVDRFGPPSSTLKIFSDSASCQSRITKGILVGDDFVSGGKNLVSDDSNATLGEKNVKELRSLFMTSTQTPSYAQLSGSRIISLNVAAR